MFFEPEERLERAALRQGDIVSALHIVGAINLGSITYSIGASEPERRVAWSVGAPPQFADAMILSHDCEIAIENSVKLTSIILAPLRDIDKATARERVEELIASNDVRLDSADASFLKYYYVEANPSLQFPGGAVVDFSKCFSLRKNCFDSLLQKKVAQLTRDAVDAMSLKLALYFSRREDIRPQAL